MEGGVAFGHQEGRAVVPAPGQQAVGVKSAAHRVEEDVAPAQPGRGGPLDHDLVPSRDERSHAPADNAETEGGSLSHFFSYQIADDLLLGYKHGMISVVLHDDRQVDFIQ